MTSKVSFTKLMIETLHRHIAAVLITVLVFFLHIISFFLNVQNILNSKVETDMISSYYPDRHGAEYIKEGLTSLSSPNVLNMIIAIFLGIYLAFEFFRYMHSRKESDFYDSMPICKEKWFLNIFTSSVGLFIILATLTYTVEFSIVCSVGYGSKQLLMCILWNLICTIGTFMVCWVSTVLAMVMTGHSIIAFLGFGAIACYIPLIIGYLIPLYANTFFETYVLRDLPSLYYCFSPISLAYKATYNYSVWNIHEHWLYMIGCYIFALLVGLVCYILFLRRPSESAGRAMAFEKINSWIRIMIVIPLALYAGLFLNEITSVDSTIWLLFGVIFAACLLHGIIEAIFNFDIKALISKKKQLFCTILFCLAFVFVFWADVFQFDNFVADEDDVKCIKIDTYFSDYHGNLINNLQDGLSGEYVDDALEAIQDIRSQTEAPDSDDYIYTNDFKITYEFKNGKTRQRRYSYYGNSFPESLNTLSKIKDFKDDFCVLYHLDKVNISSLSVFNGMETFQLDLTKEQLKEFTEIYLEEYTKLSLSDSFAKEAVYKLIVLYPNPRDDRDYDISAEYQIYTHFDKTIAYLYKYNVVNFWESQDIKLENLEIYSNKYEKDLPQYISDEQQLNSLKEHMLLGAFMYHRYDEEEYVYCNLRCSLNGQTRYMDVYIKQSELATILGE